MKSSNIGGQAVMEGVMMRNADKYAVAVRKTDGEIVVKTEEYKGIVQNKKNTFSSDHTRCVQLYRFHGSWYEYTDLFCIFFYG